jgi:tripartite-type tricarboxylate transporter receptor subunit TctC
VNLITEHIAGASPITYTDVTPIAQLFNEYVAFSVHPESAIKTGKDLVQQLQDRPRFGELRGGCRADIVIPTKAESRPLTAPDAGVR